MWWHADNSTYGLLLQGFAQADNITGPYSFVDATSPLGNWSQDFGLFTDYTDGKSYALYSNGDRKEGRDVYLTAYNEDVTALDKVVHRFDKYDLEAPTIIQTEKSYFALMSHKTGYRPNSRLLFSAKTSVRSMLSVARCCRIPRRFPQRSVVPAFYYCAAQHEDFQFTIRVHS